MSQRLIPVRMKTTKSGSEDGLTAKLFGAGERYMMAEGLADLFIKEGSAERVTEKVEEVKDPPDDSGSEKETKRDGENASEGATESDDNYTELLEEFQSDNIDAVPEKGKGKKS